MPKSGEKTVPVPLTPQATSDLAQLIKTTNLRQADLLRYSITAALRVLAKKGSVSFPLEFEEKKSKPKKKKKTE